MQINKDLIIAIDGYSACGKSTFAKSIAKELGYLYIDSGAMYRAVTLYCIYNDLIQNAKPDLQGIINALDNINISFTWNESASANEICLNGVNVEKEIRSARVSQNVSPVSTIPEVRKKLVDIQRKMSKDRRVVMDGRDIGSTVFPDADIKIFMTADLPIRTERRYKELIEKNMPADLKEVEKNLKERDFIDQNRKDSPLKKADDAIVLDNSFMTPEEQMLWFRDLLKTLFPGQQ